MIKALTDELENKLKRFNLECPTIKVTCKVCSKSWGIYLDDLQYDKNFVCERCLRNSMQ